MPQFHANQPKCKTVNAENARKSNLRQCQIFPALAVRVFSDTLEA
jgi:hypothetical protein